MIPVGYMAKRVQMRPEWLDCPAVVDIYSVSGCISNDFTDYVHHWKHNGYWLFNSPTEIKELAEITSSDLSETRLFYYECYEQEYSSPNGWRTFHPEASFPTAIIQPSHSHLEGYDVVTFESGNAPECSPLSCNAMTKELPHNAHCLFPDFQSAKSAVESGAFRDAEPGPYRIFAVYSVPWPIR